MIQACPLQSWRLLCGLQTQTLTKACFSGSSHQGAHGQSCRLVTWFITDTHTSVSPSQVCTLHHKWFIMDGIHSPRPSHSLLLAAVGSFFFWHSFCHMPGMWMSVSGDGGDLHSIFFYNFKSFLKTFDFHGNRAWNLGTAFTLNTTTFWLCTSKKKCMYSIWLSGLESPQSTTSASHDFVFNFWCCQKLPAPFVPLRVGWDCHL